MRRRTASSADGRRLALGIRRPETAIKSDEGLLSKGVKNGMRKRRNRDYRARSRLLGAGGVGAGVGVDMTCTSSSDSVSDSARRAARVFLSGKLLRTRSSKGMFIRAAQASEIVGAKFLSAGTVQRKIWRSRE